jgi:hypothetical protein
MKTLKITGIILFLFLLVPVISWILWHFGPSKKLEIAVLDKTVPTPGCEEHRSFFWILNHEKYTNKAGRHYSSTNDYFGFFPLKPYKYRKYDLKRIRLAEIPSMAENLDMVYYTDTYGVFFDDWFRGVQTEDLSTLIYGGLNQNDFLLLKEMKNQHKLIITEYNLFDYPTTDFIREKTEELFDLKWSGWTGRYFNSLNYEKNKDIPRWIVVNYKKNHKGEWAFKKSGIILTYRQNKVIVLEEGKDLKFPLPIIYPEKYGKDKFSLPDSITFSNWFDIVAPSNSSNKIVANYSLRVNRNGDSILNENNIPKSFPAIFENTNGCTFYYFAGNFARCNVSNFTKDIYGYDQLGKKIAAENDFFWNFYKPLISKILSNYYVTLPK